MPFRKSLLQLGFDSDAASAGRTQRLISRYEAALFCTHDLYDVDVIEPIWLGTRLSPNVNT
jgi:hypothetical protein